MSGLLRWRYHAADARGVMSRGDVEASSLAAAVDVLRRRSLWVIDIEPERAGAQARGADVEGTERFAMPSATVPRARAVAERVRRLTAGGDAVLPVITRAVATLLQAGVPLERALAFAVSGEPDVRWRAVFMGLRDAVTRGESLSAAAAGIPALPRSFAPLLAAAEASGTLPDTFARLADDLEQRASLQARIRAALVYPTVLAVASVIGTLVILIVVVPRFADLIAGVGGTIPASTRALILVSDWLSRMWWLLALMAVAIVAAIQQWLRDPAHRRRWHTARLGVPVSGRLEQEQAAASYLGTLAVALESGVPLLRAMGLARGTIGNAAISARMARAEEVVRDGGSAAHALAGSLPPLATRLLEAGEQSGALAALSRRAAVTSAEQVQRLITSAVSLIEPAMILGFGAIVGFVALALLQAIYGLNAGNFS